MNLNLNIDSIPVSVRGENDQLYYTLSNGKEVNVGRLSGYADRELIKPTIDSAGYLNWYDPALILEGSVFVKPKIQNLQLIDSVNTFGLYAGAEESDFINGFLASYPGVKIRGNDIFYHTNVITKSIHHGTFDGGITTTDTDTRNSYPYVLFLEDNSPFTFYNQPPSTVTTWMVEYPTVVTIDGFFHISNSGSYDGKLMKMEFSSDGVTWFGEFEFEVYYSSAYRIQFFDTQDGWEKHLTRFDEPVRAKYIRLTGVDPIVGLKRFAPFKDMRTVEKVISHKYNDISLDPNSFMIDETQDKITLKRVPAPTGTERPVIENNRTLERSVHLTSSNIQNTFNDNLIKFDQVKEIAPGIESTIPYLNILGGITLEAGNYELEVDMSLVAFDYRVAYGQAVSMGNKYVGFAFFDAISNEQLTESQMAVVKPFFGDLSGLTHEYSDKMYHYQEPLLNNENFTGRWPYLARNFNDGYFNMTMESPREITGFSWMNSNEHPAYNTVTVSGSDDGEIWTVLKTFNTLGTAAGVFLSLDFDSPVSYAKYRFDLVPYRDGAYSAVAKCYPNYTAPKESVMPTFKMRTQLALSGRTTITLKQPVKVASNSPIVSERSLKIFKLGPTSLAETYMADFWPRPLSTFKLTDSTALFNCFNHPEGSEDHKDLDLGVNARFTIYFPGPVKLYRRGKLEDLKKVAPYSITALSAESEDVSHLNFPPVQIANPGIIIYDEIDPDTPRQKTYSASDGSLIYYAIKDLYDNVHRYSTKDETLETLVVSISYYEPITVNAIKERLAAKVPETTDAVTGAPKDVVLEFFNTVTQAWEVAGRIDEQYKESLDGSYRSGAADYQGTRVFQGDGKTRFYALDEPVTATEFRFLVQTSYPGRYISFESLAVAFHEPDYDFDTYRDAFKEYQRYDEILPFTDTIPAGTYVFKPTGLRQDTEWYIEAVLGE